jgi:hypothetical protein
MTDYKCEIFCIGLLLGGFVLQNIPNSVLDAYNICDDLARSLPMTGKSAVNRGAIAIGNDYPDLIFIRRRQTLDKVEQSVATGRNQGAVLKMLRRPRVLSRRIITPIE